MTEIWKIVDICPAYEVSSLGRVRRCLPGLKRTKPGRILSSNGKSRYLGVTLVYNRVRISAQIHRLVCRAFHGVPPSADHEAAHDNGQSHDNRAENLAWKLPIDNARDRITHGTQVRGEGVTGAKLTEQQVKAIRAEHEGRRNGYAATAAQYGVDRTLIGMIVRREIWQHV